MCAGGGAMVGLKEEKVKKKQFFFEKKNQKTFVCLGLHLSHRARKQTSKSFLVLFFKKELLP
jgi:hypothetical protein